VSRIGLFSGLFFSMINPSGLKPAISSLPDQSDYAMVRARPYQTAK
jgi:hypothetical protein